MNEIDYQKLIKKDEYQVFLFHSVCNLPAFFVTHPWFVVNEKGKLTRWEGRFALEKKGQTIHKDALPPFLGIGIIDLKKKPHWPANLIGYIEGGENSISFKMVEFIKRMPSTYPYRKKSALLGPNSNTYVQWVLNNFPEFPGRLSWNAVGKGYQINKTVDKRA